MPADRQALRAQDSGRRDQLGLRSARPEPKIAAATSSWFTAGPHRQAELAQLAMQGHQLVAQREPAD